ncbi:Periplasmic protein TonB [Salmonella enterica subsp. arizonae]|nr:Periplasmic protein TonB [Salmonella enterica subsp. arizonae]
MTTNTERKYFDLHTRGIGYVNRLRTVTPKRGNPFTAYTIAALRGTTDEPEYTYIDVRVYNEKAVELLESCQDALGKKQRVLIGFNIGDIYPSVLPMRKGIKKVSSAVALKVV